MNLNQLKDEMVQVIKSYHLKGWSPATSTNYSFKDEDGQIWVSRSGIDKSQMTTEDFVSVNTDGEASPEYTGVKPSAETVIHCVIYELFPDVRFILHSHGVFPVMLSSILTNELIVQGYEIQKGFQGVDTHEVKCIIPILQNNQEMSYFKQELAYKKTQLNHGCFIIKRHGTYAWGSSLAEAKRHLETLDYICQCEFLTNN